MVEASATIDVSKKVIDVSAPFFLPPSENLGAIITTRMLNGDNYDLWEKLILNTLRVKNKGFIDESFNKPVVGISEANNWKACNSTLISWIINSINKSIQPSVVYEYSTKAVWDDLKDRFSVGNTLKIH